MDREDALSEIPAHYGVALRMAEAGATTEQISSALGIESEAVGPLIKIAEAKLRRVLGGRDDADQATYSAGDD